MHTFMKVISCMCLCCVYACKHVIECVVAHVDCMHRYVYTLEGQRLLSVSSLITLIF